MMMMIMMRANFFLGQFFLLYLILASDLILGDEGLLADLTGAVRRAAGVYKDPAKQAGFEDIVVVTGCNYGFLNHLHNFKCFADRLGIKFLVVSMDQQAHDYLTNRTDMISYYAGAGKVGEVSGSSVEFRSKEFNILTAKKKEAVHDILRLGYSVLFSDTDVVMVQDPFPYLLWRNVDYVHSINAICTKEMYWNFRRNKEEGNTGFYFVRSSPRAIKLWNDCFEAAPRFPKLDDQAIFWHIIRTTRSPVVYPLDSCADYSRTPSQVESADGLGDLVTCPLNTCQFSSGMLSRVYVPEFTYEELQANLMYRNESMVTVHANYIKGNQPKVNALMEHGLWLATKSSDTAESNLYNGKCSSFLNDTFPTVAPTPTSPTAKQAPSSNAQSAAAIPGTAPQSSLSVEPELKDLLAVVRRAAGVYKDPAKQAGFEDIVVVTGCNYGFLNHLHNFKCFADRLGIKFLVVSMDQQAHDYLTNRTDMISYYAGAGKVGEVSGSSVEFRSKEFNILTAKKKEAVHDILRLGYSVLFSDTDVVMVQDPFPYLLWRNVDYVHSINAICTKEMYWNFRRNKEEGNTGFYFVRSSPRAIKLWNDCFESAPKFPSLDDQAIFWRIIRMSKSPEIIPLDSCRHYDEKSARSNGDVLVTCPLDTCEFSSGMLSRLWVPEYTYEELVANLNYKNTSMVALHANYIKGGVI